MSEPTQPERPLLKAFGLRVVIDTAGGPIRPVDSVTFDISASETFALLGESGCGKSMTALALMRLLPDTGRIESGEVRLDQTDLLELSESQMRRVRGGRIGMIFQEPATSLNPVMTVCDQIGEALTFHRNLSGTELRKRACELLTAVGIPDAEQRLDDYPFQFSGGMKQRVMIAMALAGEPELLIADEPTTALDVTIQAQVLDLLTRLQHERGMGMLLITHDLGVVARMAHRVGVMYAGELVETGPREAFFRAPLHPYSRKLFAALPSADKRGNPLDAPLGSVPALGRRFTGCRFAERCPLAFEPCDKQPPAWKRFGAQEVRCHLYTSTIRPTVEKTTVAEPHRSDLGELQDALLVVRDLQVHFPIRKGLLKRIDGYVKAVDGVNLSLYPGYTLALVGESGCGKTTVGKAILQLIAATSGEVRFRGTNMVGQSARSLMEMRQAVQMIFQDPFASLNPRMRIGDIIEEGMISLDVERDAQKRIEKVEALLQRIGLQPDMRFRYPHEFSGGQRQRIAIARALAVSPKVIVCDEPTSALDVSVQAQLLNLMQELQQEHGLSYLFITHNLAVVEYLADEVAVMYLGRIVEHGPAESVLVAPAHPYTELLLAAIPSVEMEEMETAQEYEEPPTPTSTPNELPSPLNPPEGCHFHPRCPKAIDLCRTAYPHARFVGPQHQVRCHIPND